MLHRILGGAALGAMVCAASAAQSANIMPDFADVPTGWTTDRFEPHSFSNVGTFQGRDNVLGIEITDAESSANRPVGQQGMFYNTQGRQHVISGGPGNSIGADLYIPFAWSDEDNGTVRTDMWGILPIDPPVGSDPRDYPIIGFTNEGNNPRLRLWDGNTGWFDLGGPILYDDWTGLEILFTGGSYEYFVNGALVHSDTTTNGATGFSAVIMQAYNFGDPVNFPDAEVVDYTAYWSNSQVPEPAALGLLGLGLVGLVAARRRRA